ncbi:MAG TPA: MFS transporter [Thermoanaerobaculia bacterium]|nr:MFS transporter [Thermoanaerobaculia bacterium]
MKYDLRKVGLLTVVYASQGISPGFAAFAMPVLLRKQGVSLQAVGFAMLLLLPFAFKFVWGPWSDRLARRGTIRQWMGALQIVLAAVMASLILLPPAHGVAPFLVVVGLGYVIVSVLDTVTDGITVRLLSPEERPLGNAAQFGGYYAGSILAGGLFLAIEPRIGWGPAVAMLVLLVASGWAAGRALPPLPPATVASTEKASVLAFLRGPSFRYVIPLLLLLDMPQNVGIALVAPFLIDNGLTQAQVGLVSGTFGLLGAFAGAALGGAALARLPRIRALMLAAFLQVLPLFGFAWLAAHRGTSLLAPIVITTVAFGLASLFNVAISSWFMDQVSPAQPSTDYSLMACAHTASFALANPIAGASASALGFRLHFTVVGAVALLLVIASWPWLRRLAKPRYAPIAAEMAAAG